MEQIYGIDAPLVGLKVAAKRLVASRHIVQSLGLDMFGVSTILAIVFEKHKEEALNALLGEAKS